MAGKTPAERIETPFRDAPGAVPSPEAQAPVQAAPPPVMAQPRRKLDLRAMTGYEEEVAERRRNDPNTASLCNEIVARCMIAPGQDPEEAMERARSLLVAERDDALLTIRRLSLGDSVDMVVTCPACKKQNDIDFKLSQIPFEFGNPPERVEVTVPGDIRVILRLPTAGDQEALLSTRVQSESERRSWLLSRVIVRFGERNAPFDMQFARSLSVGVRRKLEDALEKVVPDLDLTMDVACFECGHPFKSAFDVTAFFLPR